MLKVLRVVAIFSLLLGFGVIGLLIIAPIPAIGRDDEPKEAIIAYTGARIHTAAGPVIERGVILIKNGKILDVGAVDAVPIPKGAQLRDLAGKTIIPGLVDTHSHIGIFSRPQVNANADGNKMTGPV